MKALPSPQGPFLRLLSSIFPIWSAMTQGRGHLGNLFSPAVPRIRSSFFHFLFPLVKFLGCPYRETTLFGPLPFHRWLRVFHRGAPFIPSIRPLPPRSMDFRRVRAPLPVTVFSSRSSQLVYRHVLMRFSRRPPSPANKLSNSFNAVLLSALSSFFRQGDYIFLRTPLFMGLAVGIPLSVGI